MPHPSRNYPDYTTLDTQGHCKNLEPIWSEAATKLKGFVRVAAVDATVETGLAHKYEVKGYPTIKLFGGNAKAKTKPEDYQGGRTTDAIVSYALDKLHSNVIRIKDGDWDGFAATSPDLPRVVLFSDKKQTTPLMKALSNAYLGRVVLGECRSTDKKSIERFGITAYPTVLTMLPGQAEPSRFSGELNAASLHALLAGLVGDPAAAAAGAEDGAPAQPAEPARVKLPPKKKGAMIALSEAHAANFDALCREHQGVCIIYAAVLGPDVPKCEGALTAEENAMLEATASRFAGDRVQLSWIDARRNEEFVQRAGVSGDAGTLPAVIALKSGASKDKVAVLGAPATPASVAAFIERIMDGSVSFTTLQERLVLKRCSQE